MDDRKRKKSKFRTKSSMKEEFGKKFRHGRGSYAASGERNEASAEDSEITKKVLKGREQSKELLGVKAQMKAQEKAVSAQEAQRAAHRRNMGRSPIGSGRAAFIAAGTVSDVAGKKSYDCILLDQMMPGMNGEETLKEMEKADILKRTPVIALTADAIVGAKESYISMGFSDYISKPVKIKVLEEVLRKYIPQEKQISKENIKEELPVLLIWGDDSEAVKREKDRLGSIYKCVCVVGEKARDKYLEKHNTDAVMRV